MNKAFFVYLNKINLKQLFYVATGLYSLTFFFNFYKLIKFWDMGDFSGRALQIIGLFTTLTFIGVFLLVAKNTPDFNAQETKEEDIEQGMKDLMSKMNTEENKNGQ